jgi:1-phosphofructokinase family hexose kinase
LDRTALDFLMILTVTLNPAMDRLLFVNGFTFNVTNRITRRENCVGGKGTHVSVNLACLGEPSIATGIAMGGTGRQIIESLEGSGVTCDFILSEQGDSRTNYLLIDEKSSTLICEKGPEMSAEILDAFYERYDALTDRMDWVVISGDASNFTDSAGTSLQDKLLASAHEKGCRIALDSAGASLKSGIKHSPFLIKPNAEELSELTGMPTETDGQIVAAIKSLSGYDVEIIAVSMGSKGSIVKFGKELYRAGVADVKAVNTVGCGDAYLSGLVCAIKNGYAPERALKFAAACGAAEALNPLSVGLDQSKAEALCENIKVERLENLT